MADSFKLKLCNIFRYLVGSTCTMFDPPEDGIVTCVKTSSGKICSLACKEGFDFAQNPALFYVCKDSVWSYVAVPPADLSVSAAGPVKCVGKHDYREYMQVSIK